MSEESQRLKISEPSQWDSNSCLLSIVGITGSGKTTLAQGLARELLAKGREVLLVSVDSVSAYRGLDIGSAKPLGDGLSWCGLDLFDVHEKISVRGFVDAVLPRIEKARERGEAVILVGGSHFYENAIVQGMTSGESSDQNFQNSLAGVGLSDLYERLLKCDPRWSQRIHAHDRYRISRALDLAERQGLSFDELSLAPKKFISDPVQTYVQAVHLVNQKRETLAHTLMERIEVMLSTGWMDEVRSVMRLSVECNPGLDPFGLPGLQTVGYMQVTQSLNPQSEHYQEPLEQLKQRILKAHLGLVKKQQTWLRQKIVTVE